jgi:hypothetical protein
MNLIVGVIMFGIIVGFAALNAIDTKGRDW